MSIDIDDQEALLQDLSKNPVDWIESYIHECPYCRARLLVHTGGNGSICKNGCFSKQNQK